MSRLALRDVMSHEFVGVSESDALLDAVELMRSENTNSAVVLRGDTPVGIVTTESVLDLVLDGRDPEAVTVGDVMEDTPESLSLDAAVADAADLMGRTGDPRVLVSDDDGVHGVVEARDVAPVMESRSERPPAVPVEPRAGDTGESRASRDDSADSYAEQGVCEACGGLAYELANVNGQLLCPECRSV